MEFCRTGQILNTENYEACVAFYRDLFGLPVMFAKDDAHSSLTCFDFMGSYLMVERGGTAHLTGKSIAICPGKLRFNVRDIDAALERVKTYGIDARIERHPWGATINLHDPDGNRIGIRDEQSFME